MIFMRIYLPSLIQAGSWRRLAASMVGVGTAGTIGSITGGNIGTLFSLSKLESIFNVKFFNISIKAVLGVGTMWV